LEAVERAPIRMALLGRKLTETIQSTEEGQRSTKYIEETALPVANKKLIAELYKDGQAESKTLTGWK